MSTSITPILDTPRISSANVTTAPVSTTAGIGMLLAGLSQAISSGGLPTSTPGWVGFGMTVLSGLLAIFGRN